MAAAAALNLYNLRILDASWLRLFCPLGTLAEFCSSVHQNEEQQQVHENVQASDADLVISDRCRYLMQPAAP